MFLFQIRQGHKNFFKGLVPLENGPVVVPDQSAFENGPVRDELANRWDGQHVDDQGRKVRPYEKLWVHGLKGPVRVSFLEGVEGEELVQLVLATLWLARVGDQPLAGGDAVAEKSRRNGPLDVSNSFQIFQRVLFCAKAPPEVPYYVPQGGA